jgi:hypothetical protein
MAIGDVSIEIWPSSATLRLRFFNYGHFQGVFTMLPIRFSVLADHCGFPLQTFKPDDRSGIKCRFLHTEQESNFIWQNYQGTVASGGLETSDGDKA